MADAPGTEILDSLENDDEIVGDTEASAEATGSVPTESVDEGVTDAVEIIESGEASDDGESSVQAAAEAEAEAEVEVEVSDDKVSEVFDSEPEGAILSAQTDVGNEADDAIVSAESGTEDEVDDLDDHFAVEESPPVKTSPEKEMEEITQISFEVRTPAGKKYALKNVHLDATLLEVKHMVAKMDGSMQPHEMKIIKSGKPITDNQQTVRDYAIKENQVLHVVKVLFGANPSGASGVGIRREKTEEHERGFLKVTIPQGARPGNRLIIQPPGRPRMHIIVPRGYQPGMILNVKLPEETNQGPREHVEQRTQPQQNNRSTASSAATSAAAASGSTLMKVQCPPNSRPGSEIKIMVPGKGQMKVQVPANTAPGQFFYFRVMNSY